MFVRLRNNRTNQKFIYFIQKCKRRIVYYD
nr:MAG TPA: hypothetical protein [Caudoviricetes sp.]